MGKEIKEIRKVKLNSSEMQDVLKHFVKQNRLIQEKGWKPKSLNIEGNHGLGKTTIVRDFCKENNLQYVEVNLSSLEETGDLIGLPIPEYYMCTENDSETEIEEWVEKSLPNGAKVKVKTKRKVAGKNCCWVNEKAIKAFEALGYKHSGKSRMAYSVPKWIEGAQENGVLLLDDFTRKNNK